MRDFLKKSIDSFRNLSLAPASAQESARAILPVSVILSAPVVLASLIIASLLALL